MPTTDELHAADQEHAVAIAELRTRIEGHDETLERHEMRIAKLDETIVVLREAVAKVATKDDIAELRKDISKTYAEQMRDAHQSVPRNIGLLIAAASVVVPIIAMFLARHG